jgi:hypothetical protein
MAGLVPLVEEKGELSLLQTNVIPSAHKFSRKVA